MDDTIFLLVLTMWDALVSFFCYSVEDDYWVMGKVADDECTMVFIGGGGRKKPLFTGDFWGCLLLSQKKISIKIDRNKIGNKSNNSL